ncbi:MAG: hypothetical protein K4571_08910 [Deltaproteobacteria bacterium]
MIVLVVLIGVGYFTHNKLEEKRLAGTAPITQVPFQENTDAPVILHAGYEIQPVARYEIRARVLSTERYRTGREADLSPVDFALGWGPMSDHAVTKKLNIRQSGRWYHYSWSDAPPIDPAVIVRTSVNTHLVPANDSVKALLLQVRSGNIVSLKGYLINVRHPDGWSWRSSLTREDSGAGACELMWVEEASVE